MPKLTLYTRADCCLCNDAKAVLLHARRKAAFEMEEIDIDADPALQRLYTDEVPVIVIDGRKAFKYRVTESELLKKLKARA